MFNKEEYIKSKKKNYFIDKYYKKKELVNKLQHKLDFETTDTESVDDVVGMIYDLENKYNLVTKDGKKKRYLESDYKITLARCANISRDLKEKELPFLAKIVKVRGEKGDFRMYDAIIIYKI